MTSNNDKSMDKIVDLCKSRGFVYAGSEIYGGLANSWDYGPLGVELKNNIKKAWWKKFVQENPNNVGLDSAILMNLRTCRRILRSSYGLQRMQIPSQSRPAYRIPVGRQSRRLEL